MAFSVIRLESYNLSNWLWVYITQLSAELFLDVGLIVNRYKASVKI